MAKLGKLSFVCKVLMMLDFVGGLAADATCVVFGIHAVFVLIDGSIYSV